MLKSFLFHLLLPFNSRMRTPILMNKHSLLPYDIRDSLNCRNRIKNDSSNGFYAAWIFCPLVGHESEKLCKEMKSFLCHLLNFLFHFPLCVFEYGLFRALHFWWCWRSTYVCVWIKVCYMTYPSLRKLSRAIFLSLLLYLIKCHANSRAESNL